MDVLYLFWQKQKSGNTVREIELLSNRHSVIRGLDSETWSELRDVFMSKRLITQNDKGHYLLSRDLHTIKFWQLKEWVNDEQPLDKDDLTAQLDWQSGAYRLLREQRCDQRNILNANLVELFEQ